MCHNVSQSSPFQELHDHPELISHQVAVVHLHHILMMIVPHDYHLQVWQKLTDSRKYYMIY